MAPRDVRSTKKAGRGTVLYNFETHREAKQGLVDSEYTEKIGIGALTRWVGKFVQFEDLDAAWQATWDMPVGCVSTGRVIVQIDEPFNGTAANVAILGDETDVDEYLASGEMDLSAAAGTVYGLAAAPAAARRWAAGQYIEILIGTADSTAGACIVWLEVLSYAEDLLAEDSLP